MRTRSSSIFFFFTVPPPTHIYTLSLHDALPIYLRLAAARGGRLRDVAARAWARGRGGGPRASRDRKSTRLNSSHEWISYAVFCLKKKRRLTKGKRLMQVFAMPTAVTNTVLRQKT